MNRDDMMQLIESISVTLPKHLKSFREQSGLSLRETAEKIGKSPSQLSLWERGINPPSCIDLFKLCLIYDIGLFELFPEICEVPKPLKENLEVYKMYQNADQDVKGIIQDVLEYALKRK